MKKLLLLLISGILFSSFQTLFAQEQEKLQDVLYLKNGVIHIGEIVKEEDSYVSIRTYQGVYEIHKNNIEKTTKELKPVRKTQEQKAQTNNQTINNQTSSYNRSYSSQEVIPYRNAGIATLMSILIPGGGQFYNDEPGKGIAYFLWGTVSNTLFAYNLVSTSKDREVYIIIGGISSLICTIAGIIDANNSAEIINNNRLASINIGNNKYLSFSPDYNVLNINNQTKQTIGINASISF